MISSKFVYRNFFIIVSSDKMFQGVGESIVSFLWKSSVYHLFYMISPVIFLAHTCLPLTLFVFTLNIWIITINLNVWFFLYIWNKLSYCFKSVRNSDLIKWLINLDGTEAILYANHCLLQNDWLKHLRLMCFSSDAFLFCLF